MTTTELVETSPVQHRPWHCLRAVGASRGLRTGGQTHEERTAAVAAPIPSRYGHRWISRGRAVRRFGSGGLPLILARPGSSNRSSPTFCQRTQQVPRIWRGCLLAWTEFTGCSTSRSLWHTFSARNRDNGCRSHRTRMLSHLPYSSMEQFAISDEGVKEVAKVGRWNPWIWSRVTTSPTRPWQIPRL